ncbi:hypothetical protein GL982_12055 (plasmid) [Spiroplasma citri]|uniref:DUF6364 family protein n=1 Tax=Spiroplasma citri TaxID=2133 RepID=UPI0013A0A041|nr:DUF6364 family protein [Spiroplasma citri]QIA74264.1 hypothetical protein GL982_12055 [Spiroplasma citri]QJU62544.1 hypothetical protein HHA36_09685 [Spiroplasma citri]
MAERKSIFSQAKITSVGESISETLLNNENENKLNDVNNFEIKNIKLKKNSIKKHINLTLKEDVIIKMKDVAKKNNMSVSALLEEVIEQL